MPKGQGDLKASLFLFLTPRFSSQAFCTSNEFVLFNLFFVACCLSFNHCKMLRLALNACFLARQNMPSLTSSLGATRSFARFEKTDVATVVLLRHGQSTWNAIPTFTGWCNPPLTPRGVGEAIEAGELLKTRGYNHFDVAFTSTLDRAIQTCELALDGAGCRSSTTVVKAFQLNERHYGALQGKRKDDPDLEMMYGKDQLKHWRRDFRAIPPAMDETHDHHMQPPAPLTESLAQCQERVLHYWNESIVPTLEPEKTVLIAAHSNTIRALVAHLDAVPEDQVPNIHIP